MSSVPKTSAATTATRPILAAQNLRETKRALNLSKTNTLQKSYFSNSAKIALIFTLLFFEEIKCFFSNLSSVILFLIISTIFIGVSWYLTKNKKEIKKAIANWYIIFIVSVSNNKTIPISLIKFSSFIGFFIGRRIIYFFEVPFPNFILLFVICPLLCYLIFYSVLFGGFLLCFKYPKSFGKFLINFIETNASEGLLVFSGLKKVAKEKPVFSRKKRKRSYYRKNNRRYYTTTLKKMLPQDGIDWVQWVTYNEICQDALIKAKLL